MTLAAAEKSSPCRHKISPSAVRERNIFDDIVVMQGDVEMWGASSAGPAADESKFSFQVVDAWTSRLKYASRQTCFLTATYGR